MPTADPNAPRVRLEPLPTLPVFFKLAGRRALVAGGDLPTVWKADLLAATGATVEVVAARPCPELVRLVHDRSSGAIRLVERSWCDADLAGAAIAIGSMPTDADAARFRDAAHRAGVPVNVIDKPAFCDFQFGTVVARSPLVLAITTDGAVPVLGQALRTRLESLLPQGLRDWALAAKAWRPRVEEHGWNFVRRRRFWEAFAARALDPQAAAPDEQVFSTCEQAAITEPEEMPTRIVLIGSGSGRPDDLTFSAARALLNADIVFYDADVAPETVALARREAVKRSAEAEDPMHAIAHEALRGTIAWIGTGDPATCPHWAARHAILAAGSTILTTERGLQTCPRCDGRCPRPHT